MNVELREEGTVFTGFSSLQLSMVLVSDLPLLNL